MVVVIVGGGGTGVELLINCFRWRSSTPRTIPPVVSALFRFCGIINLLLLVRELQRWGSWWWLLMWGGGGGKLLVSNFWWEGSIPEPFHLWFWFQPYIPVINYQMIPKSVYRFMSRSTLRPEDPSQWDVMIQVCYCLLKSTFFEFPSFYDHLKVLGIGDSNRFCTWTLLALLC